MKFHIILFCLLTFQITSFSQQAAWKPEVSTEGGFEFLTNSDKSFERKSFTEHAQQERGPIVSVYKSWVSEEGEFMVRYSINPPGITYLAEEQSLENHLSELTGLYEAAFKSKNFSYFKGYSALDAEFSNSNYEFFTRTLIRGNQMVLLLQAVPITQKAERFEKFFESFKFLPPAKSQLQKYSYQPSGFSMMAPQTSYKTPMSEDPVSPQEEISFSSYESYATIDLSVKALSKYTNYDFSPEGFNYDKLVTLDDTDSLLMFETNKFQGSCPMYRVEHLSKGNQKYISETYIYCNGFEHSLVMTLPLAYRGQSIVETINKSISIQVDKAANDVMLDGEKHILKLLLKDLESTDDITYHRALYFLETYNNFSMSDVPLMTTAIATPHINDDEAFNAKYYLVTALHNFDGETIDDAMAKCFKNSINYNLRSRIIESLSLRNGSHPKAVMLELLKYAQVETYELKFNTFDSFVDSMAYITQFRKELLELAANNIGRQSILDSWISAVGYYGKDKLFASDSQAVEAMVSDDLELWKIKLKANIEEDLPIHIGNFLVQFNRPELEKSTLELLRGTSSVFNAYRVCYNQLAKGLVPSATDFEKVYDTNYYWYFLLNTAQRNGLAMKIPLKLRNTEKNVSAAMYNYYRSQIGIECKDFALIKELDTPKGKMAFVSCSAEGITGKYFGLVGPLDAVGIPDFTQEASIYFEAPQENYGEDQLLETLLSHLND